MPYRILEKIRLNAVTWRIRIEAPYVAQAAKAGQFVIIRIDETGERTPLTINDSDPVRKTVTIVFQEVGTTTKKLGLCKAGDSVFDLLGPLGRATDFGAVGSVALVAGGVGI